MKASNPNKDSHGTPTILLTVDVEDWFQVENLRPLFPPASWDRQQFRVEQNTNRLLDLLDSINLQRTTEIASTPQATFFVLGWVAQRMPGLVREIQNRGHEVASHGHGHMMCSQLDAGNLERDLADSKKVLEDIIGNAVDGYRAPNFSISDKALELIRKCGYRYDSSYNNFSRHGRYGTISHSRVDPEDPVIRITDDFMELPISNLTLGKQIIPWGGGGYFRFMPLTMFKAGIRRILKQSNLYTFYMHPWELDPGQPRIRSAGGLSGWRHYLNLDKTYSRLKNMVETFGHCKFPTCRQYLDRRQGQN